MHDDRERQQCRDPRKSTAPEATTLLMCRFDADRRRNARMEFGWWLRSGEHTQRVVTVYTGVIHATPRMFTNINDTAITYSYMEHTRSAVVCPAIRTTDIHR
jgi:hypothetical protein